VRVHFRFVNREKNKHAKKRTNSPPRRDTRNTPPRFSKPRSCARRFEEIAVKRREKAEERKKGGISSSLFIVVLLLFAYLTNFSRKFPSLKSPDADIYTQIEKEDGNNLDVFDLGDGAIVLERLVFFFEEKWYREGRPESFFFFFFFFFSHRQLLSEKERNESASRSRDVDDDDRGGG